MRQVEVSQKSEMAGPFNRGDTIINKHFTFIGIVSYYQNLAKSNSVISDRLDDFNQQ